MTNNITGLCNISNCDECKILNKKISKKSKKNKKDEKVVIDSDDLIEELSSYICASIFSELNLKNIDSNIK